MERDKVTFAWIFDILLFSIIFLRCVDRYPIRHAAVSFLSEVEILIFCFSVIHVFVDLFYSKANHIL